MSLLDSPPEDWPDFLPLQVGEVYILAAGVPRGRGMTNIDIDEKYFLDKGAEVKYIGMANIRTGVTNMSLTPDEQTWWYEFESVENPIIHLRLHKRATIYAVGL
jgi:hypothetical protein